MFPFDTYGAVLLRAYLVAARTQIHAPTGTPCPFPGTAAIEGAVLVAVMVDLLPGLRLGCFEGYRRSEDRGGQQQDA